MLKRISKPAVTYYVGFGKQIARLIRRTKVMSVFEKYSLDTEREEIINEGKWVLVPDDIYALAFDKENGYYYILTPTDTTYMLLGMVA